MQFGLQARLRMIGVLWALLFLTPGWSQAQSNFWGRDDSLQTYAYATLPTAKTWICKCTTQWCFHPVQRRDLGGNMLPQGYAIAFTAKLDPRHFNGRATRLVPIEANVHYDPTRFGWGNVRWDNTTFYSIAAGWQCHEQNDSVTRSQSRGPLTCICVERDCGSHYSNANPSENTNNFYGKVWTGLAVHEFVDVNRNHVQKIRSQWICADRSNTFTELDLPQFAPEDFHVGRCLKPVIEYAVTLPVEAYKRNKAVLEGLRRQNPDPSKQVRVNQLIEENETIYRKLNPISYEAELTKSITDQGMFGPERGIKKCEDTYNAIVNNLTNPLRVLRDLETMKIPALARSL